MNPAAGNIGVDKSLANPRRLDYNGSNEKLEKGGLLYEAG